MENGNEAMELEKEKKKKKNIYIYICICTSQQEVLTGDVIRLTLTLRIL